MEGIDWHREKFTVEISLAALDAAIASLKAASTDMHARASTQGNTREARELRATADATDAHAEELRDQLRTYLSSGRK